MDTLGNTPIYLLIRNTNQVENIAIFFFRSEVSAFLYVIRKPKTGVRAIAQRQGLCFAIHQL